MEHGEPAETRELRSGVPPWRKPDPDLRGKRLHESIHIDVAIVGAGITGAMLAYTLAAGGVPVAVIDSGQPGGGSTAASTALLLWDLDTGLVELRATHGRDRAADIYRRSHAAFLGLRELIAGLRIDCSWNPRPALFLAGMEEGAVSSL